MNETLEVITDRRSIRSFKDEQIKKQELDKIIEAGLYAPSASNTQNWHFTVIQKREIIDEVSSWIVKEVEKINDPQLNETAATSGGKFFRNAPTVIIISSDSKDPSSEVNAAAATENILLAAESLGIGSCWIGMARFLSRLDCYADYAKQLQMPKRVHHHERYHLGLQSFGKPCCS